jgi:hypothetical protein
MSTWVMIGLIAAGTVAIKAIGPVALGGRELPARLEGVVARLAPSLLAALVVVDVFGGEDGPLARGRRERPGRRRGRRRARRAAAGHRRRDDRGGRHGWGPSPRLTARGRRPP